MRSGDPDRRGVGPDRGAVEGRPRFAPRALLPMLAVGLTALAYWRVVRAFFYADELADLVMLTTRGPLLYVFHTFGGHVLVLRNAVLWLTARLAGFDPGPYYWCAFVTHLLNVSLLYAVARRMAGGRRAIGALGATLWGTSPLHVGTVGWYAVYGQELVATLLLLVLADVLRHPRDTPPSVRRLLLWSLLLVAAVTSFGVGIGVTVAFPIALVLLQPATMRGARGRIVLVALPLFAALLYLALRWVGRAIEPPSSVDLLASALPTDVPATLAMLGHLFGVGVAGLVLGPHFVAAGYPDAGAVVAIGGALALAGVAVASGDAATVRGVSAVLVLALACYGTIAAGRASGFAAVHASLAAAATVGRYHYVGLMLLALAASSGLGALARRSPAVPAIALAAWLIVCGPAVANTAARIDQRAAARDWAARGMARIDRAIAVARPGQTVYVENEETPGFVRGLLAPQSIPGLAALFMLTHDGPVFAGRPVRFVERRLDTYFAYHDPAVNPRFHDLLVAPDVVER